MRTILAMLGTIVLFVAFAGYVAATVLLAGGLFLATRPIMREPARKRKRKAITDAMLALVTVAMTYRAEDDTDADDA